MINVRANEVYLRAKLGHDVYYYKEISFTYVQHSFVIGTLFSFDIGNENKIDVLCDGYIETFALTDEQLKRLIST